MPWYDDFPSNPCLGMDYIRKFDSLQHLWEECKSGGHLAWYLERVYCDMTHIAISDCISLVGSREYPLIVGPAIEVSKSLLAVKKYESSIGWAHHACGFNDRFHMATAEVIRISIPVPPVLSRKAYT